MSCGAMPASSQAALMASEASCNSLRPEFQENSVSPMPTMAALSRMPLVSAGMVVCTIDCYSSSQSTIFRSFRSWIWSSVYPSSLRMARVCWPLSGPGPARPEVSEKLITGE